MTPKQMKANQPDREKKTAKTPVGPSRGGPVAQLEEADLLARQRAVANPAMAAPPDILALGRAYGNRAATGLIQAKLKVGPVGDRYEQEADRVAEQVVSLQPSAASRQPAVQRQGPEQEEEVQTKPIAASITPLVQRQPEGRRQAEEEEEVQMKPLLQRQEEEEEIQTKPLLQRQAEEEEEIQAKPMVQRQPEGRWQADGSFEASPSLESRLAAQRGGGSPLPDETRAFMEPRFGADFSGVRLHSGSDAVQLNRELNAHAFTHGKDIYLGQQAAAPTSEAGRKLIAHELTHVIQQGGSNRRIARWGVGPPWSKNKGTSHTDLTNEALGEMNVDVKNSYGDAALKYLADHSDHMDKRAGYLIPVKKFMSAQKKVYKKKAGMYAGTELGKNLKKRVGKGMSLDEVSAMMEEEKHKRADDYDNAAGYIRDPAEAPNHAESGMYTQFGGEAGDRARIKEYFDNAVDQWQSGNPRQSLFTLALALHSAQDIGAHGHGAPGTGHDPRRFFPPPNEYAKTRWIYEQYGAGAHPEMGTYPNCFFAWCDNKDKNRWGWLRGKSETRKLLTNFEKEVPGPIHEGWTDPGWIKRNVRGLGRFLGGRGIIKHR